jgi:hypothetical protein
MATPIFTEADLRERIQATRDLFVRQGWVWMLEGWTEELKLLTETTLEGCNTLEELHFRKGAASVLSRLTGLDAYLDAVEQALDAGPPQA